MSESENFDNLQSPPTSTQTQGFQNFMDPRMSGYDPRNRAPNYDPSNMIAGMEPYSGSGGNPTYSAKMRMNDMAAMFGNPAAVAAYQQRQRMSLFGQGRESAVSFFQLIVS